MSLEKPVIFFSHSSRDKVALKKLKEKVHANASGFGQRILGSHAAVVDHVSLHLKVDETMIAKVKAALLAIPNCLERFAKTNGSTVLDLPGASVNISQLSKRSEQNPLKSEPTTVSSIQVNFNPVAMMRHCRQSKAQSLKLLQMNRAATSRASGAPSHLVGS